MSDGELNDTIRAVNDGKAEREVEIAKMTVAMIKDELKKRHLKTTGNRAELVPRLEAARLLDGQSDQESDAGNDEEESNDDAQDDTDSESRVSRRKTREKCVFTFKDVEESLEAFSGDNEKNINRWLKDFEETARLCEWSDTQKMIYAKRLLRGSAKLFVNFERCAKSWKCLKSALASEFAQKVNIHTVNKELARRKKKPDESFQEYMYAMMEIAAQVDMEVAAIIEYIVDGVQDDEHNKILLYGATSMRELKEKFRLYEKMNLNAKCKQKRSDDNRKVQQGAKEGKRCFNCGAKNHVSVDCPSKSKGTRCFRCSQYGHIAAQCTNNVKGASETKDGKSKCNVTSVGQKKHCKNIVIAGKTVCALIDTGSDLSLMRADEYIKIGAPSLSNKKIEFRGVGSSKNTTLGETHLIINIDNVDYDISVHIVSDTLMQCGMIIGSDFLKNVEMSVKAGKVEILKPIREELDLPDVCRIDLSDEINELDLSHIENVKHRLEVDKMITDYNPKKSKDVGVKLQIVLKDDIPVHHRPRRLSAHEKNAVNTQIQSWLEEGIIRPSNSDYASAIVLVNKKNGSLRICVDYRQLNEKIVKMRFPLPLIEDQIDQLQGAKVYTTLDLKQGFFHVPVEESSVKYTAFVVPDGHYEFLRAPFGLCISPPVFQRYVISIFKKLMASGVILIYMDDIIIPAKDFDEALIRLKLVLREAEQYGLLINWQKCRFLQRKINYLGYIIEDGQVKPSCEKTDAVKHFPKPNSVRAVRSFLGLTGYFRKFIPKYSYIAKPLSDLLREGVPFQFGQKQEEAFLQLKLALSGDPVLHLYRGNAETELHTDASALGYGAILLQRGGEDLKFHPVYYASGKTTSAESKYCSYELEVLAIVKALQKFRVYLIGLEFKIITDCQAVELTMRKRDVCARIARWAFFMQDFNFTVIHRPGKNMQHVDALSRHPLPCAMLVEEEEDGIIARLKRAQTKDEALMKIQQSIGEDSKQGYCLKNGLLCKEIEGEDLIVVPRAMQNNIIKQTHERGHFGVAKTETLIKRDYWFDGMRGKIEKTIHNCINCILMERKAGRQEGFLHAIDKGDLPIDTYHVDHLGPMPSTKKSYRHIFVVVDAFTKFTWLYPTRSTSATEVVNRLRKQAVIFGNPRRIISDRGSAFVSHEFEEYCTDENIEHIKIVTGVPRGNGQVERVNRILIPVLAKLSAPKPAEWHKYVESAQKYLNHIPSRSTGMTPFHLLIGARMRLKEDPQIREIIEQERAINFEEARNDLRNKARDVIQKVQAENKRTFDKRRKEPHVYTEGDLVAIQRTQGGPGLKFCAKFFGPYRIEKILRNDRYLVSKIGNHEGPQRTSTCADHMKPWTEEDNQDNDDANI